MERGGARVALASPRQLGLLAAVAAAGDSGISRDRLLLLLWPESTEAKARHALAQVLYRLRRDLGADVLRAGPVTLLIEPANLSHDLGEFLAAVAAGEPARAASIHAGPFLDGFYLPEADEFDRWAEVERSRLSELAMQSLEAAGRRAMETGRVSEATDFWRRLCVLAPLNSRFAVGFMTALAESGDAAGAMRHGRAHDLACRQELGLPPDPAVGALMTRLAQGSGRPSPRPAAAEPVANRPEGVEVPSPPVPAPQPTPSRRSTRLLAVLGVLGIALLALWRLSPLPGSSGFPEGSMVVVADPVDLTGEPGLGRALGAATAVGLQQSRRITVLGRGRVAGALGRMGRSGDSVLTDSLALEVAARENARAVFALTVAKVSDSYLLTGRLLSPADGRDLAVHQVRVTDLDDIVAGLDRLLRQIQASAGDSRADRDSLPTLPLVTTGSLEALKLYAEAGESWRRLRYDRAGQLYLRAIELDPEFALAHVALGSFYAFGDNRPAADSHYAKARQLRSRLTLREQLLLDTRLATARGDLAGAILIDRTLAERYPSRETWYNYGTGLLQVERCSEAIPAFQRSLAFDSTAVNSYLNLATCYKILGDNRLALDAYAAAERIDSTALVSFNINHEWGGTLVRLGRYAEAEAAFSRMLVRSSDADRARGHRSLAYLAMLRGQYSGAVDHLTAAVALTQEENAFLSRLRNQSLLAEAFLIRGARGSAARELDQALRLAGFHSIEPRMLALLGRVLVRAGRIQDASGVLARIDREIKPGNPADLSARGLLFAELALARGAPEQAFEAIRRDVDPGFAGWRDGLWGRTLGERGVIDSALTAMAAFAGEDEFGVDFQADWILAPLEVARLAELLGDSATARAALQLLLQRWREGDPDLAVVLAAQRSLARLQRGVGR
jgi:DNA-binding SARP family transcriptional activator/Tfp pilus assembly protein PilF